MIQKQFAQHVTDIVRSDDSLLGVAAAGSWITNELDEYSDLDLVLVTKEKITHDKSLMLDYAHKFGHLLTGFTGEHVGEPRVLICLYNDPLLHVDIKFVTLDEFRIRIENPVVLFERDESLTRIINDTIPKFPYPDYQWIEDRFWTWVHYGMLKIARGENIEAHDFFAALRMMVFGPLLHIKNGNLPRGVRKVETMLSKDDLQLLRTTIPDTTRDSLMNALENAINLYRKIRTVLFSDKIVLRAEAEKRVLEFFSEIKIIRP